MTNEEIIYSTAVADGMPVALANLITAQSKLETGNYTSKIFVNQNNAFGYDYVPGAYWQLGYPGDVADNGVASAVYDSVENSTHEITDWIKRRQNDGVFPSDLSTITTPAQYAQLLKDAEYYGAGIASYTAGLTTWLKNMAVPVSIGAILLFFCSLL